jgi:hypothetical protein
MGVGRRRASDPFIPTFVLNKKQRNLRAESWQIAGLTLLVATAELGPE